jgi:hypothetical protein
VTQFTAPTHDSIPLVSPCSSCLKSCDTSTNSSSANHPQRARSLNHFTPPDHNDESFVITTLSTANMSNDKGLEDLPEGM